jgi:hypothetical protein
MKKKGKIEIYLYNSGPSIVFHNSHRKSLGINSVSQSGLEIAAASLGLPRH